MRLIVCTVYLYAILVGLWYQCGKTPWKKRFWSLYSPTLLIGLELSRNYLLFIHFAYFPSLVT